MAETATCAQTPDRPATSTCARCGAFTVDDEVRVVDGSSYCAPCGARPDVSWQEHWRQQALGRRDLLTWLLPVMHLLLAAVWVADAGASVLRPGPHRARSR